MKLALEQRAESAAASGNGRVSPLPTLHEPYAARGVLPAALAPANAAAEASKPRRVPTSKPLVDARVDVAAAAAAAAPAVAAIAAAMAPTMPPPPADSGLRRRRLQRLHRVDCRP